MARFPQFSLFQPGTGTATPLERAIASLEQSPTFLNDTGRLVDVASGNRPGVDLNERLREVYNVSTSMLSCPPSVELLARWSRSALVHPNTDITLDERAAALANIEDSPARIVFMTMPGHGLHVHSKNEELSQTIFVNLAHLYTLASFPKSEENTVAYRAIVVMLATTISHERVHRKNSDNNLTTSPTVSVPRFTDVTYNNIPIVTDTEFRDGRYSWELCVHGGRLGWAHDSNTRESRLYVADNPAGGGTRIREIPADLYSIDYTFPVPEDHLTNVIPSAQVSAMGIKFRADAAQREPDYIREF